MASQELPENIELGSRHSVNRESFYDHSEQVARHEITVIHNAQGLQFFPPPASIQVRVPTFPIPAHIQEPTDSNIPASSVHGSNTNPTFVKSDIATCRFSLDSNYGDEVFTEARQCPVNPIALSGRYEAAIRALSPVYATPAHSHHQRAVEYHPIPQPYVYKPPPEDVTSFNTRTKRYQAYREWKSHDESIGSLLASSPQTVIHAWPQCIWKAVDENVHILDSAPRYQLQVHDRIICYGLMEGEWRLTNRVVRTHDMKIISRQEPAEWVYIVCRNDQTHQETHVKLSAECFYPSTAGIKFRRFVQKMGAPFARFPKHFSRSDNRSGFKLLFNCFGWC